MVAIIRTELLGHRGLQRTSDRLSGDRNFGGGLDGIHVEIV